MKYWVLIVVIFASCSNPIETALSSKNELIKTVVSDIKKHEVQILFTQIDTSSTGEMVFTDYEYNVNTDQYFYPASTVKLPVALLAAEFMDVRENLHLDTPYIIGDDDNLHTVSDDIRQIFAVSDNASYNRIYEILGRDYINNRLREKGLNNTRIAHRLSTPDADKASRNNIQFFPGYTEDVIELKNQTDSDITPVTIQGINKGKGYIEDGVLKESPMNFSEKNYFPLEEQHLLIKKLIAPEVFPEAERFDLTEESRTRLLSSMKALPREAKYTSQKYYDSYVKFFMYGDSKDDIPSNIKIYNKVGYAYGTLTETAYIVDTENDIRFILSATILVNENAIFNDDTYEYENIGIPFLAQLGREIYKQEKERRE
ncbi:serine hydrolase [Dokdonia sp. Dokd-P16]|uniref:serine hydrolase n=1 Tax=Dokdonia sp. Dokd-P16 TaxID=2173169 RepID=UPI0013A564B3|nr:serine hydrolase [Dokdonia sp. Dokd-P16]